MSKDFSNGNQHGHEDGKTGDNRLASRSVKRLFKADQVILGAENRHDEYRRGYTTGFEDEVRTKKVTTENHNSTGNLPMSSEQSFAHQIELLENLNQYLENFQERLLGVSANYQKKVGELHEGGLMDETHRDFVEQQLEPTQAMIQQLIEHIGDNNLPAVKREIAYLEPKL